MSEKFADPVDVIRRRPKGKEAQVVVPDKPVKHLVMLHRDWIFAVLL
jgi:hypothetical protein